MMNNESIPLGLTRFASFINWITNTAVMIRENSDHLPMKYFVRGAVLLKHCNAEFIKQVLPRLLKPHCPALLDMLLLLDVRRLLDSSLYPLKEL